MTHDDFADKGYGCCPLEELMSGDWKTKPYAEWTMQDNAAFEFQEMCRLHDEMLDAAEEIE